MSNQDKKNVLLFVSKDTNFLHDEAIRILSPDFNILKIFRFNRSSPTLNSIKEEINCIIDVDYIFNFLSPKIFPRWLIDMPRIACINFHPGSYEYPGIGSASYALFDKKNEFGVSAHYMNENVDAGGIIAERFFTSTNIFDCKSLFERALRECPKLLQDVVALIKTQEKPEVIRMWTKRAVTRQEFEKWMVINEFETVDEWNRKILALSHPDLPGPFIMIGNHKFVYMREKN